MKTIDLHGLTEQEAITKADAFLFGFRENYDQRCSIIVGNGIVLKNLVIDLASEEGFEWAIPDYNNGLIIISK